MPMLQKVSPEPMENSSGYFSNTNSNMNQTAVKYATVGRNRPGGVKRTSSLVVQQPVVPPVYKAPAKHAPSGPRRQYKNDLTRPASQASRSSGGSRRPSSRSSREAASETRLSRQRGGSRRASHSKVRRPESRASSKALIMRRRDSGRRVAPPQRSGSGSDRPGSRASQNSQRPHGKRAESHGKRTESYSKRTESSSKSIFPWKPRLTLRRSKSLQQHSKPEPTKKREIRFGDESEPGVIMMKGVEHRRRDSSKSSSRGDTSDRSPDARARSYMTHTAENNKRGLSQTLTRPPRASQPSRSQRASSAEASRRLAPVGESPRESHLQREHRYRPHETSRSLSHEAKRGPPSELSSSPPPRAPVWRAESDGSLSDTLTNHSVGSTVRRAQQHNGKPSEKSARRREPEKSSVLSFLRRTFSIKPRDQPAEPPARSRRRPRASSSSVSSLERPARRGRLKTAKSHEALTGDGDREESAAADDERHQYRSLPRRGHKKQSGTALSRRLSSLGWSAVGGRARPERSRSLKEERPHEDRQSDERYREPRNNERDERYSAPRNNAALELTYPPIPPKTTNEATRGRPRRELEAPIQPIIQERRAQSQPSLYRADDEPSQEPFSHYANLPFQLPPRRRSSPNLLAEESRPAAKRAASQPSLVHRAPSPSNSSSSTLYATQGRPRTKPVVASRKGILKRRKSAERRADMRVKNVNQTRGGTLTRSKKPSVFHGIAHNIKNVFRHRKGSEKPVGDGLVAVPGNGVVSERYVNVTNTHEAKESAREEEEVRHLGDVSNEELSRAIREGTDARALLPRQQRAGSSPPDQRRLLHQSGQTWRTVDTDDLHEVSRHDRHGELVTESAHTHQRELFNNAQVPDNDSGLRDGEVHEQQRSGGHSRRQTRDVDTLEYFSVPRGGRLADGVQLGDGLRYVQENVEEERHGDPAAGELATRMTSLGFRPSGQTSAPIEYQQQDKTNSWLNSHFGNESRSSEEEDGRQRSDSHSRDRVDYRRAPQESERRRETSTYEYQKSSGVSQKGNAPPSSWERSDKNMSTTRQDGGRSEKYTKEVRRTPEKTYIKETRESPRGGYERVQVLPAGVRDTRASVVSDMQSEVEEDPIFASKFSSGKPRRGGVTFGGALHHDRQAAPVKVPSPPPSPPPAAPPRTKRKNRLKPSPSPPSAAEQADHRRREQPVRVTHYRRDERDAVPPYSRDERDAPQSARREEPLYTAVRREERGTPRRQESSPARTEERRRDGAPETTQTERIEDGRLVKEYHFRSSESPRDSTPVRYEYRESSTPARHSEHRSESSHSRGGDHEPHRTQRRGSSSTRDSSTLSPPTYYLGQRGRSHSTEESEPRRYTSTLGTRLGGVHHQSIDQLDRPRAATIDRRLRGNRDTVRVDVGPYQSQTLPRKPRRADMAPSPTINRLAGSSNRFGGSLINVSVKNQVVGNPPAPRKPARSPVRRSSSLYSKEGSVFPARAGPEGSPAPVVGVASNLRSPDILSQIQRTASMRRDSTEQHAVPPPPPMPSSPLVNSSPFFTSSSLVRRSPPATSSRPARSSPPADDVQRRNADNTRASQERSGPLSRQGGNVIPVSVTTERRSPPAKIPPKVAPKPRPAAKENFMRGLMQTAPELYSALHGDERKDSKTPSPKQSPPMTPPPPLHRAQSPASPQPLPFDYGLMYPKTPPIFKRIERLRADEEVVTKDGRSRSTTPAEDVVNFRMGTMSPTGERTDVIKVQR